MFKFKTKHQRAIEAVQELLGPGTPIRGYSYTYPFRVKGYWEARVVSTYPAGAILEHGGMLTFLTWSDIVDYCQPILPGEEVAEMMEAMNAER